MRSLESVIGEEWYSLQRGLWVHMVPTVDVFGDVSVSVWLRTSEGRAWSLHESLGPFDCADVAWKAIGDSRRGAWA